MRGSRVGAVLLALGYGHEWLSPNGSQTPYGETASRGWDATAQLWAFFAAHPRPAG